MTQRLSQTLALIFAWVLTIIRLHTIEADAAPQYNFRHIDSRQGLSANNVKAIVKDGFGFMWFGTKNGLNRYDGSSMRTYEVYDEELRRGNNNVGALYEDEDSVLWIGTDRGVYQYDHRSDRIRFAGMTADNGSTPGNWVQTIAGDGKGSVWVLMPDEGLYHYEKGKLRHFSFTDNSQFKRVMPTDICIGSDGTMWALIAGEGLYRYRKDSDSFIKARVNNPEAITDSDFWYMCESPAGTLMAATINGTVYEYCPSSADVRMIPFSRSGNIYLRDVLCFDNELWIASQAGIYVFNLTTGAEEYIDDNPLSPFSLSDNSIYCMYRDNTGDAWLGTMFGGVSYMPRRKFSFSNFGLKDGLQGRLVLGLVADRQQRIWIGSETSGLNVLDPRTGRITSEDYYKNAGSIAVSVTAYDGIIYPAFSRAGLMRINPDDRTVSKYFPLQDGMDDSVYCYMIDSEGNEWIGASYALYRRKKGETEFRHIPETGYDWIYCMHEDSDGNLWFGTMGNGIWKYNKANGQFRIYTYDQDSDKPNGLRSNSINSIMEDSDGCLWLSTDRGGLSRYDKATDSFFTYGIQQGLPDNVVYGVVEDRMRNLWFGTNKGLVRLTPEDGRIRVFTADDGLPFEQFNYKSALLTSDGTVYMGGTNGLISFRPDDYNESEAPLPIYFTGLTVLNEEIRPGDRSFLTENILFADKIKLNHDESTFSVSIASPEYRHLGKVAFSYRLLPVSEEWIALKGNEISFANLAIGKYVLEIKAESESNTATRRLEIIITPPWWKSIWAYCAYVLLFVLAAVMWFRWYRARKEQQLRMREKSVSDIKDKELYRSKVNFFTEIAHEIRTPLSLIDLPLEAMEDLKIEDPQFKKYLNVTRKNTRRLLELTGQLLDFEKIDSSRLSLKNETVNVPELLTSIADRFETPLKLDGKSLTRDIDESPLVVATDREALTKIVSNLLNNARKYGDSSVSLELKRTGYDYVITVSSDGEKIKVEDRDRIFTAFYQGESALDEKSGVGIGLPLSRSLATLLGGSLTLAEDGADDCNTFVLTLPIVAAEDIMQTDPELKEYMLVPESNQAKPRPNVFSILLVEDNETILSFLAEQLSSSFVVTTASNGVEALEKLKYHQPDLILTDIMMPEMDGLQLCNAVKSDIELSHIPLVFITAINDLDSKVAGLQMGAEAYVEKPFSIKYLINLITSIIDNRRREREAVAKNPFLTSENVPTGEGDREFMEKVRGLIEEHMSDEDYNVDRLCESLNMSRSALLRKVKSVFGMSPIEVIRTIKLKRAAELIQDGRYRISDVCYMVGIATPSYFSKLFFKHFGMTPKDFEKQSRAKNAMDESERAQTGPIE